MDNEYRPFKPGEMPADYFGYIFRELPDKVKLHRPIVYRQYAKEQLLFVNPDNAWMSNLKAFELLEVQIKGSWWPVGVHIPK